MNPMITFNDKTINIKIIDDKESHYQLNIPNNNINKDLIENTIFKFEKSGTQIIIMHDDIHVFQLSKMECKYSDYIKIQKQLKDTQKNNDLLNSKITDKEELQQQINIYYDKELDRLEQELNNNNNLLQQQIKLFNNKSIADKKDIDMINIKLNNTDSLLQQQIKMFNDKSIADKEEIQQQINIYYDKELERLDQELNNNNDLLQQQIKLFNNKSIADKKDIDMINSKLNNTDSSLQQQIKMLKDEHKKEIDNLKNELNDIKTSLSNNKSREDKIVQLKNEIHFLSNKILSDKKEIDTINSKLNNTDSLLQQQINIHSYLLLLSPIVISYCICHKHWW